jgi:hypothetical protein
MGAGRSRKPRYMKGGLQTVGLHARAGDYCAPAAVPMAALRPGAVGTSYERTRSETADALESIASARNDRDDVRHAALRSSSRERCRCGVSDAPVAGVVDDGRLAGCADRRFRPVYVSPAATTVAHPARATRDKGPLRASWAEIVAELEPGRHASACHRAQRRQSAPDWRLWAGLGGMRGPRPRRGSKPAAVGYEPLAASVMRNRTAATRRRRRQSRAVACPRAS